MASHLRTELVADVLEMAVCRRKPAAGVVHYYDCGMQRTALSFGKKLEGVSIVPSMGRAGSALDNAISLRVSSPRSNASSSIVSSPTREAAGSAVFEYLEAFYNRRKLHSSLGYLSPESHEKIMGEGVVVAWRESAHQTVVIPLPLFSARQPGHANTARDGRRPC